MQSAQSFRKLAVILAASFLSMGNFAPAPALAEGWVQSVSLKLNDDLTEIVDIYDTRGFGSGLFGGGLDPSKPRSLGPIWALEYARDKQFTQHSRFGLTPGLRFSGTFATGQIHFPQGLKAFIEPITMTSNALIAKSTVYLRSAPIADRLTFETGATLAAIKTWDHMALGSWNIYEELEFTRSATYLRADYAFSDVELSPDTRVTPALFAAVIRGQNGTTGTIGLKVEF